MAEVVGYARVSTQDQKLDLQTDALDRAGCERECHNKVSGRSEMKTYGKTLLHGAIFPRRRFFGKVCAESNGDEQNLSHNVSYGHASFSGKFPIILL